MKNSGSRILLFFLAVTLIVCGGCAPVTNYSQADGPEREVPEQLAAQPDIEDPGERVSYRVSGCFSDHMVLQRDAVIQVWGWSDDKGAVIYGEFMGEKRYAVVDEEGAWLIQFSPKTYATEGQTLSIYPKNGRRTEFTDVLVGDVWFVVGQSNAEYYFSSTLTLFPELREEVDENDNIRLYREDKGDAYDRDQRGVKGPQKDVASSFYEWKKTKLSEVLGFSSLGYLFVKEISKKVDVPQGIIMATAGGCMLQDFMPEETAAQFETLDSAWSVGAIYNFLIAPFTNMAIRGMVFYQGESDETWYEVYPEKLRAFVAALRENFNCDFAFYNVQLSSHGTLQAAWPNLPGLRAAQTEAYYMIPHSYLICSMDVGWRAENPEEDPAHPYDKWTIAKRLAAVALCQEYGLEAYKLDYVSSPIPSKITWKEDSILVDFSNTGDGLQSRAEKLTGFRVINEEGFSFVAEAEIVDRDTVKVSFDQSNINGISYGYTHSALPAEASLANSADVPAVTFRMFREVK